MNLRAVPYFRLLLPFSIGIALADWKTGGGPAAATVWPAIGMTVLIGLGAIRYSFRYRWIFGAALTVVALGAGYGRYLNHHEGNRETHFSKKSGAGGGFVVGRVCGAASRGSKLKLPLEVEGWGARRDSIRPCRGRLLLFLEIDSVTEKLGYGDRLVIRGLVQPVPPPRNPHAFDYRRYLHLQNLHYQAFIRADSIWVLSGGHGNRLWRKAYGCRDRLLDLLRRHFPTPEAYAVASALLVGYKDELPEELRTAYAETGSMHALAVSGTHVGILYAGLMVVLGRLPWRGRRGRLFQTVLVLAAIWGFTLLTGATASVLRASVMFSLYLAGRALHREASIWNVLASSAFGLLLYNPYFLFDAGFQLSYAAVAGMVFFYPRLYRISPVLPRWADEAWKVLLVGLSAQIGTLPLSLYYFHQFPVYFWLAGWVVVLGGALFLWGGAALVALDALWPLAAGLLGKGLYGMVWAMNWVILAIQRLPGAVINGIWLPGWAAGLLYLGLVFFAAAWAWRNGRFLIAALTILLALSVCRAVRSVDRAGQHAVVAYAAGKVRLLDFVSGEAAVALHDSLSPRQIQFTAQANRWALGVRSVSSHSFEADTLIQPGAWAYFPPSIQFAGYRIALIDHARRLEGAGPPQAVHTLILSGSPRLELAACLERFPASLIVFDATNSPRQVERWKAECQALNLHFHDIRTQGAWSHHW